jgi:hypothetical protein
MSKHKSNGAVAGSSDVTSAGAPWSEVPDFALADVEWMYGRHGSAKGRCHLLIKPLLLLCCLHFLICTRIVHADQRP